MSTTTSLDVALEYSLCGNGAVLLRLRTSSFMQRGADIAYLSAFPAESENLFPPLTLLKRVGSPIVVRVAKSMVITVVDVVPHIG